jgi:O-antigen/teichoic acid export membrane protein
VGSDIRHAIPLAIAAALTGLVSLLTTVFVAHVLSTRGYGTLIILLGLFLVVSQPGTALLVSVVRRVSSWRAAGLGDQVRPWVARVHRIGEVSVVVFAVLMLLARVPVAHALSLPNANGVTEVLAAAGVWVVMSIDRGLLQVSRDYTDLSLNLIIEAVMRCALTVGMAAELGVEGAALGLLIAELVTATHARFTATRAMVRNATPALSAGPSVPVTPNGPTTPSGESLPAEEPTVFEQEAVTEATASVVATAVHSSKDLVADVLTALASLLLLALLQNLDVIILGSKSHGHHSGAYAAISVPSKALVFVALVLVNYLLPEATIRHQAGSHALKQLAQTFAVLAIPCLVLLGMAVVAPHSVLSLVFGHHLTAASHAFSTIVLAMILMSVTVVLAIYLLGIGWRWVVIVLAAGAGALAAATAAAHGEYLATARADLAVQAGLCVVTTVCFVAVHRSSVRRRARV